MANSAGYHESENKLRPETLDNHRALTSMQEELEAADWYDQRVDAATDTDLKQILAHNRDEEKEHFAMLLEWYRRRDATMDTHLRDICSRAARSSRGSRPVRAVEAPPLTRPPTTPARSASAA